MIGKIAIAALLTAMPLQLVSAETPSTIDKQSKTDRAIILYHTRSGNVAQAASLYRGYVNRIGHNDYELVEQMARMMIEQGARCSKPEEQLLAIYGAGISRGPQFIYILEEGINNPEGLIQLASLQFLEEMHDDKANQVIRKAMASQHLVIRLEVCLWMAKNRDPQACGHVESLYEKVPAPLRPIFPQLFAACGDPRALSILRQMLTNVDPLVRLAAIEGAVRYEREELIPQIRSLAMHPDLAERELCAAALGELKDEASVPSLEKLAKCGDGNVSLAALSALYQLGRTDARLAIDKLACGGNLYAISMLAKLPGSEETLWKLCQSPDIQVRVNAVLALLELQDCRCIPKLREIFLKDARDLLLTEQISPGHSMVCWKVITSAKQQFKDKMEAAQQLSVKAREQILLQAADLPVNEFLCLVEAIFQSKQAELVPLAVQMIEQIGTKDCIDFLKVQLHRPGAPLVRHYCNLALFRLQEPGPYAYQLYQWIACEKHNELIHFEAPETCMGFKNSGNSYPLTPTETSRLLIDSLTALAEQKDSQAIDALLHVIAHGNPNNRYALAGLLARAVE